MAQHTPPQPDEHISMELEDSAIDDTGAQSAAAAAAAALVALPQAAAAAAADAGESQSCFAIIYSYVQAGTGANECSRGLCMLLCRCLAGAIWRRPAQGLGWTAVLSAMRQAAQPREAPSTSRTRPRLRTSVQAEDALC